MESEREARLEVRLVERQRTCGCAWKLLEERHTSCDLGTVEPKTNVQYTTATEPTALVTSQEESS